MDGKSNHTVAEKSSSSSGGVGEARGVLSSEALAKGGLSPEASAKGGTSNQ